ncbi:MAG: hypothetical protein ACREPY_12960 [Rhodanobacteraceae bacterium]
MNPASLRGFLLCASCSAAAHGTLRIFIRHRKRRPATDSAFDYGIAAKTAENFSAEIRENGI